MKRLTLSLRDPSRSVGKIQELVRVEMRDVENRVAREVLDKLSESYPVHIDVQVSIKASILTDCES